MMAPRRLSLLAALVVLAMAGPTPALAERLVISVSRHQVMVNSSFTGTSIVLFGTVEPDTPGGRQRIRGYDIVATVTGSRETVVTRRKGRVLGIWANVDSRTFVNVPSYLLILANRAFDQVAPPETLRRLQVGFDYTVLPQQIGPDVADVVRDDPFRVNFIRLKVEHGLYGEKTNGVTFLTPTVFRAEIPIPAQAQIGNYDVDVKLFAEGAMIARTSSAFEIIKVGFEQFVASAARDYALLYGLAVVAMAVFTGWFASVVFRRD
jgi:uncharacterized protein (TIGR02186 family)